MLNTSCISSVKQGPKCSTKTLNFVCRIKRIVSSQHSIKTTDCVIRRICAWLSRSHHSQIWWCLWSVFRSIKFKSKLIMFHIIWFDHTWKLCSISSFENQPHRRMFHLESLAGLQGTEGRASQEENFCPDSRKLEAIWIQYLSCIGLAASHRRPIGKERVWKRLKIHSRGEATVCKGLFHSSPKAQFCQAVIFNSQLQNGGKKSLLSQVLFIIFQCGFLCCGWCSCCSCFVFSR